MDANNEAVGDVVTVRHLLQHRSGVPKSPPDLEQKLNGDWTAPDLPSELTERWQIALTSPVGQFQYSNLGYALLGAIVERTELCSFAVCMKPYLSEVNVTPVAKQDMRRGATPRCVPGLVRRSSLC